MTKKIFMILFLIVSFIACKNHRESEKKFTVGAVFMPDGFKDKSINDSAYSGLKKICNDEGIKYEYKIPSNLSDVEESLEKFVENKDDLVVAIGFLAQKSIIELAKKYPHQKFLILDDRLELPNVTSVIFDQQEGAFLMGSLAAMMTKSNKIGFIGGMEAPIIEEFENGYIQGAKYINPNIQIISKYTLGVDPFSDPKQGRKNTRIEINKGADVIYHAAGKTGLGVIKEAKQEGVYAIGADTNQDALAKGTVLTSMMKRFDIAIYNVIKNTKNGNFKGEVIKFDLSNNGVSTTEFKYTKNKIGLDKINKLNNIKNKIINKKIKIKAM